jgi:hypothetical protein
MYNIYFPLFRSLFTQFSLFSLITRSIIPILSFVIMFYFVHLIFILFALYLLILVGLSYLIYLRINYLNTLSDKRFTKLFFEGNLLKLSTARVSVFLSSVLFKFGILAFLIISTIFMLVLFIITSQFFLNIPPSLSPQPPSPCQDSIILDGGGA